MRCGLSKTACKGVDEKKENKSDVLDSFEPLTNIKKTNNNNNDRNNNDYNNNKNKTANIGKSSVWSRLECIIQIEPLEFDELVAAENVPNMRLVDFRYVQHLGMNACVNE